jgi:cytochrome c556
MKHSALARARSLSPALVAAIVLLAGSLSLAAREAVAQAAPSEQAVIEYRQLLMSAVGSNMGAIGGILKNQLVLPGAIANHAQQMADGAKLIGPAFQAKVIAGKTDAKAEIWSDWAKFEKSIADYEKAATNLATAAKGSDPAAVGLAVRALGESCGGCHDAFRKPKEESYKSR